MPNVAPNGSWTTANRPALGMFSGCLMTRPPSCAIFKAVASTLVVPTNIIQCGGAPACFALSGSFITPATPAPDELLKTVYDPSGANFADVQPTTFL
jgi:hypothetical protein